MNHPDIAGHYEVPGMAFSIAERGDRLVLVQTEIPDGFEPLLDWTDETTVRVLTGPLIGAELSFDLKDGRVVGARAGGVIPIEATEQPPARAPGSGLRGPLYQADREASVEFEAIWEARISGRPLAKPKHQPVHSFVQWLMARDEFIFHGSTRTEIVEFRPRRESVEIGNVGGHGNLEAVYGTHQGLWAMFFAIVDRSQLVGSISNGVSTYTSAAGESIDVYRFSIERRSLAGKPFCPGAVYVFSRADFKQVPLYPGGPPSNEWACFTPVRPLASIPIEPEDFPFLDRIGAHDDGDLGRLWELDDEVFGHVLGVERVADGIRLLLEDDLDVAARDEWIELGLLLYPDVARSVVDATTIVLAGPPAFLQQTERRLANLLE
jgi:hypothetical protein